MTNVQPETRSQWEPHDFESASGYDSGLRLYTCPECSAVVTEYDSESMAKNFGRQRHLDWHAASAGKMGGVNR